MANNRMYLVHKPTGLGVCLGKRMGWGWYDAPSSRKLEDFYQFLERNPYGHQDDFILIMEDADNSSCSDEWSYTGEGEKGFVKFDLSRVI